MHRFRLGRRALLQVALPLAVAPLVWGAAQAQDPQTVRIGHIFTPGSEVNKGMEEFARIVEEQTDGRYDFEILPSSQLGSALDLMQQVSDGSLEISIIGPSGFAPRVPPISMLEAPFVARDFEHLERIFNSDVVQGHLTTLSDDFRIYIPDIWYYGSRHFTTKDKALNTPADMEGLKFRVPENAMMVEMVKALGGTPTPMSFGEVYLGLQTGVVDGQENPIPTIYNNKFNEVQGFLALDGHIVNPLVPFVNTDFWEGLPDGDRAIFQDAFVAGGALNDELTVTNEAKLLEELKAGGMTVTEPDREVFKAKLAPFYEQYEPVWGEGVIESLSNL